MTTILCWLLDLIDFITKPIRALFWFLVSVVVVFWPYMIVLGSIYLGYRLIAGMVG